MASLFCFDFAAKGFPRGFSQFVEHDFISKANAYYRPPFLSTLRVILSAIGGRPFCYPSGTFWLSHETEGPVTYIRYFYSRVGSLVTYQGPTNWG